MDYGASAQPLLHGHGVDSIQHHGPTRIRSGKARAPRMLYEQRRCCMCVPPLAVAAVAAALAAAGVLLLVFPEFRASLSLECDPSRGQGLSPLPDAGDGPLCIAATVGIALICTGVAFPLLCLWCCILAATPSRRTRAQRSYVADALLEEMCASVALPEHYDVFGADKAANGTVVLLAGAACPRITMRGFAEALGTQMKVICLDLPGHGSLVNVAFSLARSERLVSRVLEREMGLRPGALSSSASTVAQSVSPSALAFNAPPLPSSMEAVARVIGTQTVTTIFARTDHVGASAAAQQAAAASISVASATAYSPPRVTDGGARGAAGLAAGVAGDEDDDAVGLQRHQSSTGTFALGSFAAPNPDGAGPSADARRGSERAMSMHDAPATLQQPLSPLHAKAPALASPTAAPAAPASLHDVLPNLAAFQGAVRQHSVVLVSYAATAYVAAYYATRHPDVIAGVCALGPVPSSYNIPGCCKGGLYESTYRLRWAASLVNFGVKGRVRTHPKASEAVKRELLQYDWHVGVLPEFIREVSGQSLLTALRSFSRRIYFLGPTQTADRARRMFSIPNATVATSRGLTYAMLPTLNPAKLSVVNGQIAVFAASAYDAYAALSAAYAAASAQPSLVAQWRAQLQAMASSSATATLKAPARMGTGGGVATPHAAHGTTASAPQRGGAGAASIMMTPKPGSSRNLQLAATSTSSPGAAATAAGATSASGAQGPSAAFRADAAPATAAAPAVAATAATSALHAPATSPYAPFGGNYADMAALHSGSLQPAGFSALVPSSLLSGGLHSGGGGLDGLGGASGAGGSSSMGAGGGSLTDSLSPSFFLSSSQLAAFLNPGQRPPPAPDGSSIDGSSVGGGGAGGGGGRRDAPRTGGGSGSATSSSSSAPHKPHNLDDINSSFGGRTSSFGARSGTISSHGSGPGGARGVGSSTTGSRSGRAHHAAAAGTHELAAVGASPTSPTTGTGGARAATGRAASAGTFGSMSSGGRRSTVSSGSASGSFQAAGGASGTGSGGHGGSFGSPHGRFGSVSSAGGGRHAGLQVPQSVAEEAPADSAGDIASDAESP